MRETKKALNTAHLELNRCVKFNSPRARDHLGQVPPRWRWQCWNATGYRVRTTCSFMARHRVGMPRILLYLADAMCRVLVGGPHAIQKEAGVPNVSEKGRESLCECNCGYGVASGGRGALDRFYNWTSSALRGRRMRGMFLADCVLIPANKNNTNQHKDVLIVVLSKQLY